MLYAFDESQEDALFYFPVVVGKHGMAWGRGVHAYWMLSGTHKKEGDGKTPAGLFKLGVAFGKQHNPDWKLPFFEVDGSLFCVDDPTSKFYNAIVSDQEVVKDWTSAEEMKRDDQLYDLGIVVEHNTDPVTPSNGSCIFMHIWRAQGKGTEGCTAMPREHMEQLLNFLDPDQDPHLLQLPKSAHSRFFHSLRDVPTKEMTMSRLNRLITP